MTHRHDMPRDSDDAAAAPYLVIDQAMALMILTALIRRQGGTVTLTEPELQKPLGIGWALEAWRTPDKPTDVRVRVRKLTSGPFGV